MIDNLLEKNNLWHEHLDALENTDGAENYFIKKIKPSARPNLFDNRVDYLATPFTDEDFGNLGEGQLSLDVYQSEHGITVKATMAGVAPENIEINLDNDLLTIRGLREESEHIADENYLYHECYWGRFSRSIVLPIEVDKKNIEAYLRNGVLTIQLPKAEYERSVSVPVQDLDQYDQ
jgi:HSP20 family protein